MSEERLKEIKDSIYCLEYDFAVRSDDSYLSRHLQYERDLYNEVIRLREENKHLDKVNCQLRKNINNNVYKSRIEKVRRILETLKDSARWERHLYEIDSMLDILNGRE